MDSEDGELFIKVGAPPLGCLQMRPAHGIAGQKY